jgi:hypothetical protein
MKKKIISGTLAVCLMCVLFVSDFFGNYDSDITAERALEIITDTSYLVSSVTPTKLSGRMIEADTDFLLTTTEDLSAANLKSLLALEPAMNFDVVRSRANNYRVSIKDTLPEDSIVRVVLLDRDGTASRRWAFQTTAIFKILSSLPAHEGENVPVNTGIEINFSAEINPNVMTDYFSIEPRVNGRFERFRNTIVFVPAQSLQPDTVYTVTVKAGLPSTDGLILNNGLTFAFKTAQNRNAARPLHHFRAGDGITETFLPGDPVVIDIFGSHELLDLPVNLTLYQYRNAEAYRKALSDNAAGSVWGRTITFPSDGLRQVYSSSVKPMRPDGNDRWRPAFIILPENLEEGYYLADLKTSIKVNNVTHEYHAQKLIQVNPLSVYAARLPNEAVFFINDTRTGNAANNTSVQIMLDGNTFSANTGADGTALVRLNSDINGNGILTIRHGTNTYIDLINCRKSTERTPRDDYFAYIYTDREIYRTTDEIYVWGTVFPRSRNTPPPTELYLQAGIQTWRNDNNDTNNIFIPVELKPDGTFTAVINVQNMQNSWSYNIALMTDDFSLTQKNVTLQDFIKPTYVFSADLPDVAWMPHRNPVNTVINASFFEGTPAEGIRFQVSEGWNRDAVEVVTNARGRAATSILTTANECDTWRPQRALISFRLTGIENEYWNYWGNFTAFYRDVMLEWKYNNGTLDINTSKVDLSNWDNKKWDNDNLRGEPVNVAVTGTLTRTWHEKIQTGSHYDFIQKRTVTTYRHERREEVVGTYTVNTRNGTGSFRNLPVNIPDSRYTMNLEWKDTLGQTVKDTVNLRNYDDSRFWRRDDGLLRYTLGADSDDFKENQMLSFKLYQNDEVLENIPRNARIFYTINGINFHTFNVTDKPSFTHRMLSAYIPNVNISGAYFDGRHIYPISSKSYRFNYEERELTVDIRSDKTSYSPSETARITVTVRNADGRIVPNAAVSLSITDEAVFAVRDQNVNTLGSIYASMSIPRIIAYVSYVQRSVLNNNDDMLNELNAPTGAPESSEPRADSAADSGGDDSTHTRSDFRDTAAFLTGTTDSNGRAVFNVKLPDNLTSWRLTAQAVRERSPGRIYAGNTKEPLIVSIPFFLTVNSLPQYIQGDDIAVSARVNGRNVGNPEITGRITGNGVDRTITAGSNQTLNFGKLPLGRYTLRVSSRSGSNSDAVELPLEVVETLLETPIVRAFNLKDGININPLRYPVSVMFYDNEYKQYGEILRFLSGSHGNRADFRVANAFAQREFGHINEEQYKEALSDISSSGMIRLLPYSERDLELTALISVADPEIVNKNAVVNSLNNQLLNGRNSLTAEEVTWCYLGLAALNQPVLIEITEILNDTGLGREDRLRLIAALALLGDDANALRHYRTLGNPRNDSERALALITAGVLNLPEAEGFAQSLMSSRSREQVFVLELMTYLQYYNPKTEGNAVFTYRLNGRTETVELNHFRGITLRFGERQFANADFKVISGDVAGKVFYTGRVTEKPEQPTLNVTKTYTVVEGGSLTQGALVRVTITVRGSTERWYTINDVIPSGARFTQDRSGSWLFRTEQRVTLYTGSRNNTATYYIRFANAGEYVTESAVVRDSHGNWGISERGVIVVR